MQIINLRSSVRRSVKIRRMDDRRKAEYPFGSAEWLDNIENYYVFWPNFDRRQKDRRIAERRQYDRRGQQNSELFQSESKNTSSTLSQAEIKLIEDLYFHDLG
jgi:hypothetical protein